MALRAPDVPHLQAGAVRAAGPARGAGGRAGARRRCTARDDLDNLHVCEKSFDGNCTVLVNGGKKYYQ